MQDWVSKIRPVIEEIERAAYQRGVNDTLARIMAIAKPNGTAVMQQPLSFSASAPTASKRPMIDVVRELIRTSPGLRGTAIVDAVSVGNPQKERKSIDRTTRTALMRLKKRGLIESRSGAWFPKEAA